MRKSLFDKIFLGFLFLFIFVFLFLTAYSTSVTKKALAEEKKSVLTNEAFLIAEQTVVGYIQGLRSLDETKKNFEYYSKSLDASIWLVDEKGIIVASANAEKHPKAPANIRTLNPDFDITVSQSFTGTFYGTFDDDIISVAIPITTNGKPSGMLLMHATEEQLHDLQANIIKAIYVPFLILLVVSFTLLGLISGKIMRPIKKINSVAEQYSTGNFDEPMGIHSDDEIGQLAATLEYMASELSKLDEYRKDFISNISHDFRSPLTSIKGYVEAIQDGTIPYEMQDKYLGIVVEETQRLSKLTNGLLELNKFDTYGIWLLAKEFDIVSVVKSALNTFEGKCKEKNISLIFNNHCKQTFVNADKTKIQQVIYNLLDNAIKFTPESKNIYITLTEKNEKLFVSVKDEGCGIAKEDLKKIWVRFYKADASRGKDKQGTGLGLAITKEIIKAHNENINVISTEGVGTEFIFSLAKVVNDKETNEE